MIGIIPDLHLKQYLSYSENIKDGRVEEENTILDFIVSSFSDCNKIVFIGDLLHSKTNGPEVIKKLVNFIERFSGKKVYIISGNHEKLSDGKTSIDFLKEIKNDNWKIMTNKVTKIDDLVFCPNISKQELGITDDKKASKAIMDMLPDGNIFFSHYAVSNSKTIFGGNTDLFREIILDRDKLSKKYKLSICGHIHSPQQSKNVIITGSVFMNEVNEDRKSIWKVNEETYTVDKIDLPGRDLLKVENPTKETLKKFKDSSIIKVVLTDVKLEKSVDSIAKMLERFESFMIIEQFPNKRKKVRFNENLLEFSIEELLSIYSKQRNVNIDRLKSAFKLIK